MLTATTPSPAGEMNEFYPTLENAAPLSRKLIEKNGVHYVFAPILVSKEPFYVPAEVCLDADTTADRDMDAEVRREIKRAEGTSRIVCKTIGYQKQRNEARYLTVEASELFPFCSDPQPPHITRTRSREWKTVFLSLREQFLAVLAPHKLARRRKRRERSAEGQDREPKKARKSEVVEEEQGEESRRTSRGSNATTYEQPKGKRHWQAPPLEHDLSILREQADRVLVAERRVIELEREVYALKGKLKASDLKSITVESENEELKKEPRDEQNFIEALVKKLAAAEKKIKLLESGMSVS